MACQHSVIDCKSLREQKPRSLFVPPETLSQLRFIQPQILRIEANKDHLCDPLIFCQEGFDSSHRNLGSLVLWKTINASADIRECDRMNAILHSKPQAVAVGICQ